ncbi:Putative PAS domain, signal transduction response regulator, receiver domain, CheY-like superfamily [Septoria linicola]|uniref:histidine kinase n=1 Tax=Septoria linicola TaxID=215465 RepID=A0A9Q9B9P2_9PEZI|nr:putative PAS domain, signal transduction response regulator, receiver domain, CheY-like superfamily [Septoria linicola]USW58916.1 Putative PAS domain, signal transduction response regulator, receiver domain, CheY-like superfamily [Septoria linicola]
MWSESEAPTVEDIFAILRLRDKDWLRETLRERYDTLQSAYDAPSKGRARNLKHKRESTDDSAAETLLPARHADIGPYDLTAAAIRPNHVVSNHITALRALEWSATDLGPMSTWSAQLRRNVNFLLVDPRAAVLYWGPNRTMIYNEPYSVVLADRHPWAMGKTCKEVWPEVAGRELADAFAKADATGQASRGDRAPLFITKRGFLEEMYGDWSILPIIGSDGNLGYYNTVLDLTDRVHEERQMATLLKLERQTADSRGLQEFWPSVLEGLEPNREEVPFAALYSAVARSMPHNSRTTSISSSGGLQDPNSILSTRSWSLEGALGVTSTPNLFQDCMLTGKTQVLQIQPTSTIYTAAKSRAYGDQCNTAVLLPLGRAQDGDAVGFLVLGLSSRRYYDLNYKQFIRLLTRQLCSTLNAVRHAEEDAHKANMQAELAALDRMLLSEKLALTQQQARDNEQRFRSIASHMPMAMYEVAPSGDLLYANDSYYELLGVQPDQLSPYFWVDMIHEEDKSIYEQGWSQLVSGESVRYEARLKQKFIAGDALSGETIEAETWFLSAAYCVKSEDGSVSCIQGVLLDISRQKLLETYQAKRLEEAMELKRQQEHFMDFVGHEIRNPLSATSLCASSIQVTLEDLLKNTSLEDTTESITIDTETIRSQIENTEIITTCIQHQKRIIDDILTLSKLDSNLLVITPCETNPSDLIAQSLRLFDAEGQAADTQLRFVIDKTYQDLDVDWVMLDPSRLLQILINLITNAIRFSKNELTRTITVTLAATSSRPQSSVAGIHYLHQPHATPEQDEDNEDSVYLLVAVSDTGCGMKADELERIFLRFQQSSHKTHIEYGGSGLGLFISRELARLQGGQIGVHSQHGVGSTFEFYIKSRRCDAPKPTSARLAVDDAKRRRASVQHGSSARRIPNQAAHNDHPTHILLVEDNLVNQKVMDGQLRKAGYQVHLANHGGEALEHIRRSQFCRSEGIALDVVLMDIEMPVMGGLECTQKMRSMESRGEMMGRHLPIVAITAGAGGEQQTQALDAGMDAVVTKPFQMSELLGVVRRLWNLWREE